MKKYGYFDDSKREYVVTEPLTPRPWINYVSNTKMGAFISQGAGGLAWFNQPVTGRLSRYDFMGLPEDRPGFYIYLRDSEGACWNPSFQPCQTSLDFWECRHGMGYTRFLSRHGSITTELKLFIPPEDNVLIWDLEVVNEGDDPEKLFITNYLEFSLFEYYKEMLGWIVLRNQIRFKYDAPLNTIKYEYFVYEAEQTNPVFVTSSGKPSGFDCDREKFIGRGRSTANPEALRNGALSNSELPGGGLGIAALGHDITLRKGESHRIAWSVGAAPDWQEADALSQKYQDLSNVDTAFSSLQKQWGTLLANFQTDLPDPEMQSMVNIWNPYGSLATFYRDRDISNELPGLASGIRFRDAMQNCLTMCHLQPEIAKKRIELLLRHQKSDGSTLDSFLPGSKVKTGGEEPRCDNPVWSPITVYAYLAETGDLAFLDQELPYYDESSDTVYHHLMKGLRQISRDSGKNGLPCLKGRDWDDHLSVFKSPDAESVMTAQNWCYASRLMKEICEFKRENDDAQWLEERIDAYAEVLNTTAWDGEWYQQVIFPDQRISLGSKDRRENKIYINTQAWACISGTAPKDRAKLCMDKMREYLNTDIGIKFLVPPYTGIPEPEDPLISNGPGLGENGGIFVQANCWAIMGEAMIDRGERAYEYYRQLLPPVISGHADPDVYKNEPYMFCSHIVTEPDARKGMGNLTWLTGSVNWMYIVATQHILGIRPTLNGLSVKPAIPAEWKKCRITRIFRGCTYNIEIVNENKGESNITVDGVPVKGTVLPIYPPGTNVNVKVTR